MSKRMIYGGESVAYENGEWVMYGSEKSGALCLNTVDELCEYINATGFLPLFKNDVPGFSVEEHTRSADWWSDDEKRDPWAWRQIVASREKIAYGKFFDRKAGFVSLEWLPCLANYRRNGYDFDALWDEGKASYRQKKIMECFSNGERLFTFETKQRAGFGKNGEKNFEGTITELEMHLYLVINDFRCRINKKGLPYGWQIAVYATPETIWGYDCVTAGYSEEPVRSYERIIEHIKKLCPEASEEQIDRLLR